MFEVLASLPRIEAMKWPRWLPRLATEPVREFESRKDVRVPTPATADRLGIRDVGNCEICGRSMQARTRREEFRGRVDCDCGSRNHVEYREVRRDGGIQHRHVTVTAGRRFEAATHKPDLRLDWRYGICPSCSMGVCLVDAHVIAHEDATGTRETIAYYCSACHTHDDVQRGRLVGHDGSHVVDTLHYQLPPGVR
jgi:hypothetical protein